MVEYDVVRVFTDEDGQHGNPLGVVDGAAAPTQAGRQRIAHELGYSETVFIDDAAQGRIQIFTPTTELPFAGHPTVGAAWWLREQGYPAEWLVVPAGDLTVSREGDRTRVRARTEWAPDFTWRQLDTAAAVEAADPADVEDGQHYLWAWIDEGAGRVRARMFAPAMGIAEDEATGAAAIGFTGVQGRDLDITQGEGSRLYTTWEGDGWATVGGRVVKA